jgi:hypothetical protein
MVGVMLRREKIRKTSIKSIGCVRYYSLSSVDWGAHGRCTDVPPTKK